MPFRATFQCLWCGRPHQTRGPTDLEGWAQLCPDCLGRVGENAFLRFLLKRALAERAQSGVSTPGTGLGLEHTPRARDYPRPATSQRTKGRP